MASELRSIFIVRRDRPDLYEHLDRNFGDTAVVILDRREGERRDVHQWVTTDRRRRDRRQMLSRTEQALWREFGYCVVFQAMTTRPPSAAAGRKDTLATA